MKFILSNFFTGIKKEYLKDSFNIGKHNEDIVSYLNEFLIEFIIKGKFVKTEKNNEELEKQSESFINEITATTYNENNEVFNDKASAISETVNLIKEFKRVINEFINISQQLNSISYHVLFQKHEFIESNISYLSEICEYCNLYILDLGINDSLDYLDKIERMHIRKEKMHKQIPFKNLNIFEHKLDFLRYKWIKRKKYIRIIRGNTIKNYSEKIILNSEIIDLDKQIKINDNYYPTYKDWINKIEFHYFTNYEDFDTIMDKTEYSFVENSIKKKDNLDTYDIFIKIKYFKDIICDLDELKKLSNHFDNYLNTDHLSTKSKKKNELYYYNNYFSLLVETEKDNQIIENLYLNICKRYTLSQNYNFFIHLKYLKYKIEFLKNNLVNKSYDIEPDFNNLNEILEKLKFNFDWSKKGYNLLYDFDQNTSFVKIHDIEVYHASSFSLPLSVIENSMNIKELEKNLESLEKSYNNYINDQTRKKLNDELSQINKKSIETISLFTAIISFIVGSIGAYKFIETMMEVIIFILIYSYSISLFVLLIFISTKGVKKMLNFKGMIFFVYLFLTLLICICINLYSDVLTNQKLNIRQERILNFKLDSINSKQEKKLKLKFDSVIEASKLDKVKNNINI